MLWIEDPYMTTFKNSMRKNFLYHHVLLSLFLTPEWMRSDQWSDIIPHQYETARRLSTHVCISVRWRTVHRWPAYDTWVRMELRSATRTSSSLGCRPSLDAPANSTAVTQTHNSYSAALCLFITSDNKKTVKESTFFSSFLMRSDASL